MRVFYLRSTRRYLKGDVMGRVRLLFCAYPARPGGQLPEFRRAIWWKTSRLCFFLKPPLVIRRIIETATIFQQYRVSKNTAYNELLQMLLLWKPPFLLIFADICISQRKILFLTFPASRVYILYIFLFRINIKYNINVYTSFIILYIL